MSTYYIDTSALVKRYVSEAGSNRMENLLSAQDEAGQTVNEALFSRVAIVETTAAIARYGREGKLGQKEQASLIAKFFRDVDSRYHLLALTEDMVFSAAMLTQVHPLRGYDAVHLATAIHLERTLRASRLTPLVFLTSDAVLLKAAVAEGLNAENPADHKE